MRTRNGCAGELAWRVFWWVPFESTARRPGRVFTVRAVSGCYCFVSPHLAHESNVPPRRRTRLAPSYRDIGWHS